MAKDNQRLDEDNAASTQARDLGKAMTF